MRIFNLVVVIISLIFVGLGCSLNYNVFKKINEYNLKFKAFFNPRVQEKLNKNYTSAAKILGTSDIGLVDTISIAFVIEVVTSIVLWLSISDNAIVYTSP